MEPIGTLLASAQRALGEGNLRHAVTVCQAVIEKLVVAQEQIDDSDGVLGGLIEEAFSNLFLLYEYDPDETLRDEVFLWASKKSLSTKLMGTDAAWNLADLAGTIASATHEGAVKKLVVALKQQGANENAWAKNYHAEGAVRVLLSFFFNHKTPEETWQLIEANIKYNGIRTIAVNKCLKDGDLSQAIELANGGIKQANIDKAPGHVVQWYDQLLKIYKQQSDSPNIIRTALWLFMDSFSASIELYHLLRKEMSPAEWQEKRGELLGKFMKHGDYASLAEIYAAEGERDELMRMLGLSNDVDLIKEYESVLLPEHQVTLQNMYFGIVKRELENNAVRGTYRECARILKSMLAKYDRAEVSKFADHLRSQYKIRKALIEEFGIVK